MFKKILGCRDYLLKGKHTFEQVVELIKLTGYSAGFSYYKELGPVAFIRVPNPNWYKQVVILCMKYKHTGNQ